MPKIPLPNSTAKASDMITSKNGPLSATPQASGDGLSFLNKFRLAAATFAIILSLPVEAPASPRVAATVVEAALPVATRVAAIEAVEKTAGAVVSRNVSAIVADSAAQATARRTATATTRQAGSTATEAGGSILTRPDRSKEILAVGVGAGLGTGLYSGMSKTGDGIKSFLENSGKGAGDAIRETPKSIPFLTAAVVGISAVTLLLVTRVAPGRKIAVKKQRISEE